MDLVEVELVAEQRVTFLPLLAQHGERVFLHLMLIGVDLPLRHVAIAPLGGDDDRIGVDLACTEPTAEKLFCLAVGARRVEVADAEPPRRVQHGMALRFHGRHAASCGKFIPVAQSDVAGPTQGGQAQPHAGERLRRPAQRRGTGRAAHVAGAR